MHQHYQPWNLSAVLKININSSMLLIDDSSIPKKKQSFSQEDKKLDEQEALHLEATVVCHQDINVDAIFNGNSC